MKLIIVLFLCSVSLAQGQLFKSIYEYFYPQNQLYIEKKALSLFYYTKVATCDPNEIQAWSCGYFCDQHPGMKDIVAFHNPDHDGQAYAGYNSLENRILVSNRNTQSLTNFIEDSKFLKTQYGCDTCYVHIGFLNTYMDVRDPMINQVKYLKQKYPFATVTLVGHSLGGAATSFLAVDLSEQGIQVDEIYTYGSPRPGNQAFAEYFNRIVNPKESFRVVHNEDMVVHLPPNNLDYFHLVQEIFYNEKNTSYQVCSLTNFEDPNCSYSKIGYSISDHTSYYNIKDSCDSQFYKLISKLGQE